ncbi:hypothetical protein FO519_009945, partial [Halicephalobus sp. NKZ332]
GNPAKSQGGMNPENTIFAVNRLTNRTFNDPLLQYDIQHWPFTVIDSDRYRPKVKVEYKKETRTFFPEEIISMILTELKVIAETYLGAPVCDVVITVPSYFGYVQRQYVRDAAAIARLNILRLVNDPIAGATAYGIKKKRNEQRNILMFDLGGGVCNVAILAMENDVHTVMSIAGNNHLGGESFDNRMVDYFVQEFKEKYKKDLRTNPRSLFRLKKACENAKKTLSTARKANIELDSLLDGIDFFTNISRSSFEGLCEDLFRKTISLVEKALQDAKVKDVKIDKTQIHDIVLVGGSTRIPKIRNLLAEFFPGKTLNQNMNPDEAAVSGAAVRAAILSGDKCDEIQHLLLDVIPLSLGVETEGGVMTPIIERNTTIPIKISETVSVKQDEQSCVWVKVYEGENKMTPHNDLIAKFKFDEIPLTYDGVVEIEVTFDVDASSILTVSAEHKNTGKKKQITITNNGSRLSKEEIENMTGEVEKYRLEKIQRQKLASVDVLGSY